MTPFGEVVQVADRGLVFGNRGCLHDADGTIVRGWATRRWIACRLAFRGRRRAPLMAPGRYTELFFLDEATAFAAGHRPCAECRREDYVRLQAIWRELHPGLGAGADAIDAVLHDERVTGPVERAGGALRLPRRTSSAAAGELPDGAMVTRAGATWVVVGGTLRRWGPGGYSEAVAVDGGARLDVLTPPSLVAVLRSSWEPVVPLLHPSARG